MIAGTRLRWWPHVVAFGFGSLTVLSMWLTWFRSGSAPRNSFGAFRAAQLLDLDFIEPFRVAWFLLPVMLAAVAAAWLFDQIRLGALLLFVLGLVLGLSGAFAAAVIGVELGSVGAAVAGLGTVICSFVTFLIRGTAGRR